MILSRSSILAGDVSSSLEGRAGMGGGSEGDGGLGGGTWAIAVNVSAETTTRIVRPTQARRRIQLGGVRPRCIRRSPLRSRYRQDTRDPGLVEAQFRPERRIDGGSKGTESTTRDGNRILVAQAAQSPGQTTNAWHTTPLCYSDKSFKDLNDFAVLEDSDAASPNHPSNPMPTRVGAILLPSLSVTHRIMPFQGTWP